MAYEIFKRKATKEDYFQTWDSENYDKLTDALKDRIYEKYQMKSEVFSRDEYLCQNKDCKFPDSPLTLHHVKFQKNGGKDSARNCITLCKTCHSGFHRGKRSIALNDYEVLPSHMRGSTFSVTKDESIDWKKVKAKMKALRKTLANERVYLTIDDLTLLMKFLETIYTFDGDDD